MGQWRDCFFGAQWEAVLGFEVFWVNEEINFLGFIEEIVIEFQRFFLSDQKKSFSTTTIVNFFFFFGSCLKFSFGLLQTLIWVQYSGSNYISGETWPIWFYILLMGNPGKLHPGSNQLEAGVGNEPSPPRPKKTPSPTKKKNLTVTLLTKKENWL